MRTTHRLPSVAVIDQLFEQPHSFEFFQAVRLLEAWFVRHEGLTPNEVMAQRLSFRNSLSMSFPASEIEQFETLWRDQPDLPDRQRTTLETIAALDGFADNPPLLHHHQLRRKRPRLAANIT